jgi:hypothetical protein
MPSFPGGGGGGGGFSGDAFDRSQRMASMSALSFNDTGALASSAATFDSGATLIGGEATVTHKFHGLPPGISASEVAEQIRRGSDMSGLARSMRYARSFRN